MASTLSAANQPGLREITEACGPAHASSAGCVTLRQLNRRCGPLSDTTTAQIQALPLGQLEALAVGAAFSAGVALLDFTGPAAVALACADHAQTIVAAGKSSQHPPERATERVAVLMTPTEKAAYADRAHSLGLSLGQFFREAGAAYTHRNAESETRSLAQVEALEAALMQLELSTSRTEQTLDAALAEVRAALGAQP